MASILLYSRLRFTLIPVVAAVLALPVGVQAAETLAFKPNKLAFGGKALGESGELTAVLNNATNADITILDTKLNSKVAVYSFTTTCGSVLEAGKKCAYTVKYAPKALVPASAVLQVATSDPAFPLVKLKLRGNLYPMLNDTGITECGDASYNNRLACPVEGLPRQDASHGRDATTNDAADGDAGFNFTKLDSEGQPLSADAAQWDCVRDNVTGLVWEVKPLPNRFKAEQGLHDADDAYAWNSGPGGYAGQNATCYGYLSGDPSTYCNTQAYVNRVNAAGWCGFKDWRMPSVHELIGLIDEGAQRSGRGAVDRNYFPDTVGISISGSNNYWTSTPAADTSDVAWMVRYVAWMVNFLEGSIYQGTNVPNAYGGQESYNLVRLVRGGQ